MLQRCVSIKTFAPLKTKISTQIPVLCSEIYLKVEKNKICRKKWRARTHLKGKDRRD